MLFIRPCHGVNVSNCIQLGCRFTLFMDSTHNLMFFVYFRTLSTLGHCCSNENSWNPFFQKEAPTTSSRRGTYKTIAMAWLKWQIKLCNLIYSIHVSLFRYQEIHLVTIVKKGQHTKYYNHHRIWWFIIQLH